MGITVVEYRSAFQRSWLVYRHADAGHRKVHRARGYGEWKNHPLPPDTGDQSRGETTVISYTPIVNMQALYRHADVLNVNKLYTNDLDLILRTYGAEACSRAIVNVSVLLSATNDKFNASSSTRLLVFQKKNNAISLHRITSRKKWRKDCSIYLD